MAKDQQKVMQSVIAQMKKKQLQESEEMARYWKAQYEIRYYTLEAEKLQPAYNEYLEAENKKRQELAERQAEDAANNQKQEQAENI